jgi:hypothetical protein
MSDIEELINTIVDQDFAKAGPTLANILTQKMDDALEQQKVAVADQVFNGVEETDDDISDEDLDDAVQDALEDDEEFEIEGHAV